MIHFSYLGARNPRSYIKTDKDYQVTDDIYVRLQDDTGVKYSWHFFPGFKTDFGSVPRIARLVIPNRSDSNDILNMAYLVHDGAYSSGLVHRDIADQMLHDILLDAGIAPWKARLVKWAVHNFAEGHYGPENDTDDNDLFVELKVYSE